MTRRAWPRTFPAATGMIVFLAAAAAAEEGQGPEVGDPAPEFTLESSAGESYSLSAEQGENKVLVVFFRGTW